MMSNTVAYFLEFVSESDKGAFIDHCRKEIGWAWEQVEPQIIDSGPFITYHRDNVDWRSNRWWKGPWELEMLQKPPRGEAVYITDAHDAVIAMAQFLCSARVIDSNFGFVRIRYDGVDTDHIERQYWNGHWTGFKDPQERLDIRVTYDMRMDPTMTMKADDDAEWRVSA